VATDGADGERALTAILDPRTREMYRRYLAARELG